MFKLKNYKKSYLVINIILFITLVFLLLNVSFIGISSFWFLIAPVFIPLLILVLVYGYERKKRRFSYECLFYVFAFTLFFLLITYIIGIFVGFNRNVYKFNLTNIFTNIIPYFLLIAAEEVLRYEIIRKGEDSKLAQIMVTIIFILIDASIYLTSFDLNTGDGQIKYICSIFFPSVFKHIFLTVMCRVSGPNAPILYRVLMDLRVVVLPIFPNFGIYIDSIVNTLLPFLVGGSIYAALLKYNYKDMNTFKIKKTPLYKYILLIILVLFVVAVNLLVSCSFKYGMIAIGSGSMTGTINKGDAVIYEEIDDSVLKVGDILVFKNENKTVVHRIISIVELSNTERAYYTKGDYNKDEDGYPILKKQIVGIVRLRVKYAGIPSLLVKELLN